MGTGVSAMRVCAGGAVLLATMVASDAAAQFVCTETPPIVCRTTSESIFLGLMFGQPLRIIDFETLPNGHPAQGGEFLTPEFNYTSLGVAFSAAIGQPQITAPAGFRGLQAFTSIPFAHNWLIGDFPYPTPGVGIYFPGHTTLTAFDASGSIIASQAYGASGGPWFIGIVSEIPIARVTIDRNSNAEVINDFIFSPVPEPASVLLLGLCMLLTKRFRRR